MVSAILLQVMFDFFDARIIRRDVREDNFDGCAASKMFPSGRPAYSLRNADPGALAAYGKPG